MEYFLMQQDKRYINTPVLKNVFQKIDKRNICQERCNSIENGISFEIASCKEINYLDILDGQLFIVSTLVKGLLAKYEPDMIFKTISLVDFTNGQSVNYWLPILDDVACIGSDSVFNVDKTVLKKIVIDTEAIPDKSIFRLARLDTPYVIVRLDLAESIMRRDFKGLKLTRLETQSHEVKRK